MQPVPVKRIEYHTDMLNLWSPDSNSTNTHQSFIAPDMTYKSPRYLLATSLVDADADGKFTRFICRFHTVTIMDEEGSKLKEVVLGETLSSYPYNPEHANYLKRGSKPMLTSIEQGHDEQIWNSVYSIHCPVPELDDGRRNLATIIALGAQQNGVPSIYLDLVPIRTPVRRQKEGFGLPDVLTLEKTSNFDPKVAWGENHVLPRVEASGRWSNIPICSPPAAEEKLTAEEVQFNASSAEVKRQERSKTESNKTHFLVGCVWASRSFSTRGQQNPTDSSTSNRLLEFLSYHINIAGFDHIYVYDNSDTSTDEAINATLAPIIDLFRTGLVSRIPWPHRICNNNRPANSNPGERSSQYAAEASCRARYGPNTEWLISMDVDEYLIPISKQWGNIKDWLKHITTTEKDTQILSFYQTRALPNIDLMIPYNGTPTKSCKGESTDATNALNATCAMKVRTLFKPSLTRKITGQHNNQL